MVCFVEKSELHESLYPRFGFDWSLRPNAAWTKDFLVSSFRPGGRRMNSGVSAKDHYLMNKAVVVSMFKLF